MSKDPRIADFYIQHTKSGKFAHVLGGGEHPGNDTPLVLFPGTGTSEHARWNFYFLASGESRGYILHVSSGMYVHPEGGSPNPENETRLVVHEKYNQLACEFEYDDTSELIRHSSSGMYVHPKGGLADPENNTELVLHNKYHDNTHFRLVPVSAAKKQ